MSLSKENYDKLNENYLYKKEPIIDNSFYVGCTPGTYHCKNWTFKVNKLKDGRAYMLDTYFNSYDSHCIQVTDKNIGEFEIVFDFKEVKQIRDTEADEYNKEDLYYVATNSGGFSCGGLWWVKKDAVKSKELLINKAREKVESLKRQLRRAEDDLEKLVGKL
jgi:hypothetical protein